MYSVIIAPEDDLHARVIHHKMSRLQLGVRPIIVDFATFPVGSTLTMCNDYPEQEQLSIVKGLPALYGHSAPEILQRRRATAHSFKLAEIKSIWYRRPRLPVISPDLNVPRFRRFAADSMRVLLQGWIASVPANTLVVNDPLAEERAELKLYQIDIARKCGLNVPNTCISYDIETIESFVKKHRRIGAEVIYKPLTANAGASQGTQIFTDATKEHLSTALLCPTIFQTRVIGVDIRVVVVGERIFAIEQVAQSEEASVDIRADAFPKASPIELPNEPSEKLLKMQRMMGLCFGAYDLKRTDTGEFWFLEVNPSGQWLWVETDGNHPISEAIVRFLTKGAGTEFKTKEKPMTSAELDGLEHEDWKQAYRRAIGQKKHKR